MIFHKIEYYYFLDKWKDLLRISFHLFSIYTWNDIRCQTVNVISLSLQESKGIQWKNYLFSMHSIKY